MNKHSKEDAKELSKKILTALLIILITGFLNAKLERIDDNYYRITSVNVKEIAIVYDERDYYVSRNAELKKELKFSQNLNSQLPIYTGIGGFILGVLIAK